MDLINNYLDFMQVNFFDTTLRDGEQTNNVSFSPEEKLLIAENLLTNVKVDFLEIGSCKVSNKEKESIQKIAKYAKENNLVDKISVLSFVDFNKSIDWVLDTDCKKINLLTKGSRKHCKLQLKKTIKEHIGDIAKTIEYANKNNLKYSFYLEDWSRGIEEDFEYVKEITHFLQSLSPQSIILCDTMGILNPWKTTEFINKMKDNFNNSIFEFHCHNDYGLAVANSLYAVMAGIKTVHTTINGLGERAGNTNLIDFSVTLQDHLNVKINVDETQFQNISNLVERFSGKKIPHNAPVVGRDVFTQTAGIHADGDNKGNLYKSQLNPSRFNRVTEYSLGKMSGKANLEMHLKEMGILLTLEQKTSVLERIITISDSKKSITSFDLPFIIADVIGNQIQHDFEVIECIITSSTNLLPVANIKIRYKDQYYTENSSGNGGYDAFMNCLQKMSQKSDLFIPNLLDFEVSIPQGGKTDALVETIIIWQNNVKTTGISADQIMSAIKATEKAINHFIRHKIVCTS